MPNGARSRPMTTMSCGATSSPRRATRLASGRRGGRRRGARRLRSDRLLDQARDRIGHLGALMGPVIDAVERQAQAFLAFACDRVVETDPLDEPAVATVARIGDDDVEKRPLLGAAARESDDYHGENPGLNEKRR